MLANRFGNLVDEFFAWPLLVTGPTVSDGSVRHDADGAEVEVDLPGFARDEIEVTVEGDTLAVKAHQDGGRRASVRRAFRLRDADPETVKASLRNGVLTVRVDKPERSRKRQIEVDSD